MAMWYIEFTGAWDVSRGEVGEVGSSRNDSPGGYSSMSKKG